MGCWLKTGVGDPSSWADDPNVISGLATGTPPSPTPPAPGNCQAFDHKNSKSYTSQRQGSDTDSWDGCCAQCVDDCSGWTYVYNGAPGAKGQCWLKTGVGDPSSWDNDPNVISGLPASGRRLSECQSFDHKNSKSYSSQWQGSDTDSWDGCCSQCRDHCSGWTYVYNGAQGAKGQCWLKTGVGDPSSWEDDPTVISGLATGTPPSPTPPAPGNCQAFDHKNSKSYTSQRQGSDTDSWDGCCAQCVDDCSGWTYVYNGAPGAKGQCWLKTGVGDPSSWDYDPNVISGLPASRRLPAGGP